MHWLWIISILLAAILSRQMLLVWVFLGIIAIIFIGDFFTNRRLNQLRRSGQYPAEGRATDADVQRLVDRGDRILAIRCYREVHPEAGLAEAKNAVEKLQPTTPA